MKKVLGTIILFGLIGLLVATASGGAAPPPGPPPIPPSPPPAPIPAPLPSGTERGYPGAGLPDSSKKNSLFHYEGVVLTINLPEGFIEILDGPINPNSDWSILPPRKVGIGEDTRITQNNQIKNLTDLKIGYYVSIEGIYPKAGLGLPDYFTTDFWGTGYRGEIIHGTIVIRWDDNDKLKRHEAWAERENVRIHEYHLTGKVR